MPFAFWFLIRKRLGIPFFHFPIVALMFCATMYDVYILQESVVFTIFMQKANLKFWLAYREEPKQYNLAKIV
jgi:hypothetical protein